MHPVPLADVLAGDDSPLALTRLLESRDNAAREAAVGQYLEKLSVSIAPHPFATFEGRGENLSVEIGSGDRVLVLIAHHDAVPGSPGANDNAAAVGILLHLLPRLSVPPTLRVRLLFTAAEELGYLGARVYVRELPLDGIVGVLSLELCGIGDSLVIWDAETETPFLRRVTGALDGLGLRRDEGYHVVGRIPVFGSDHRAFAAAGIPAYGLTMIPLAEADALRRFVLSPVKAPSCAPSAALPHSTPTTRAATPSQRSTPRALDAGRAVAVGPIVAEGWPSGVLDDRFGRGVHRVTQCVTGWSRNSCTGIPSPPHEELACRLEGLREGRQPGVVSRRAAALHLDCDDRAAGTHHEVHLAVAFAPVEQFARARSRGVGQVRAHRRLPPAGPTTRGLPAPRPGGSLDGAVISAVLSTCSFGLEPRCAPPAPRTWAAR